LASLSLGGFLVMTADEIRIKISQVDADIEKVIGQENADKKGDMLRQYREFLLEQLNNTSDE
jgi:AAA+ superfamily predicted ATPase